MSLRTVFLGFVLLAGPSMAAAPNFAQVGFSTLDGGTRGGAGGAVVTPTTLEELKRYAEDKTTPYVIRITKEFNTGIPVTVGSVASTYADVIRLGSNKTLIGIGSAAFFNRIGIRIQCQSNIVIRNIRFTMKDVPYQLDGEVKILGRYAGKDTLLGDPDCIGIQADDESLPEAQRVSRNIWIDHNEFYNEDPSVMTDKDRYDGLVDTKNNSYDITISWNYFHDHHKASLIGKGASDAYDHKTTYHHNYFKNIAARLPLFRYGVGHLFNNYMVTSENGANARVNSDLYIEANVFEDSKKPVFGKTSESGAATFVSNKWINCARVPAVVLAEAPGADVLTAAEELLAGTFKPSYPYAATLHAVGDVATVVPQYSGVGKISTTEYDSPVGVDRLVQAASPSVRLVEAGLEIHAVAGTHLRLTDLRGAELQTGVASAGRTLLPASLRSGVYLLRLDGETRRILVP